VDLLYILLYNRSTTYRDRVSGSWPIARVTLRCAIRTDGCTHKLTPSIVCISHATCVWQQSHYRFAKFSMKERLLKTTSYLVAGAWTVSHRLSHDTGKRSPVKTTISLSPSSSVAQYRKDFCRSSVQTIPSPNFTKRDRLSPTSSRAEPLDSRPNNEPEFVHAAPAQLRRMHCQRIFVFWRHKRSSRWR